MFLDSSRSEKMHRTKTENSIKNDIPENVLSKQFVKDQINEYMIYYDTMMKINYQLANKQKIDGEYIELIREKRQISKEMRNILDYLTSFNSKESKDNGIKENEIKL